MSKEKELTDKEKLYQVFEQLLSISVPSLSTKSRDFQVEIEFILVVAKLKFECVLSEMEDK